MKLNNNKFILFVSLLLCLQAPLFADDTEEGDAPEPEMKIGDIFKGVGDLVTPGNEADKDLERQEKGEEAAADNAQPANPIGDIFNSVGSVLQGRPQKPAEGEEALKTEPNKADVEADSLWADYDDTEASSVATAAYKSIRTQFLEHALNLRYGEAATLLLRAGADHRNVEAEDVWQVCETWLNVRNFSKLKSCIKAFETQIRKEGATELSAGTNAAIRWNIHMGEFQLHRWRAIRALEFGYLEKAIEHANEARKITDNSKIEMAGDSIFGMLAATSNLLGDAVHGKEDGNRKFANRFSSYDVYGVLAVAHAQQGNQAEHQRNLDDLIALTNERYTVEYKVRYWLVLAYLAAGKYEDALRESKLREKDILDAVDQALIELNPIVGVVGSLMGTADVTVWRAYGLLEYQYIKAHSLYKLGKLDQAKLVYDSLLKNKKIKGLGAVYLRLLFDRAVIAEEEGDLLMALSLYTQAIDVVEKQRSTIATESGKLGFTGGQQKIYERAINLLLRQAKFKEAFEYVERAKSRALVDMLASRKKFSGGQATVQAAGYVRQLTQLDNQDALIVSENDKKSIKLRSASDTVRQKLKQEYPELASLVTVDTDTVEGISSRLAEDEQLLEYYQQDDKLYAFLLSKNSISAYTMDGFDLDQQVLAFRRSIREESPAHRAQSQKLYQRLIAPLAKDLNKPRLLIVAHGALHYLPFNALNNGKQYLVDKHSIRLLPSASVLRFLDRQRANKGELLVLGNPDVGDARMDLPGAENEARQLAGIWSSSNVLLRRNASETAVRASGQQYSHLHFASHGKFDADDPLNSRLLLAGDSLNDGNLTVGEMYELRLNADMVTLSACETGLGKISSGDDVVGLTRGFLYAGARSIVASLWEVADEPTAYIMVEFYRNLQKMDKAAALRQAQISTRKKYPHPLYWAAFQLTGSSI